jgi:hypothetical protein
MTTHDDSNLELLERDLVALAQPREQDELVRLALRRELTASLRPPQRRLRPPQRRLRPPQRRRRLTMRLALDCAAVTAAAAAIALVVLVGTTTSGGPAVADAAIIHHALTAVTPPANEILHEEVVGVQNGVRLTAEWWQETSAPYASRGMKGAAGHQGEFGDNGTTSFEYDPSTNTVYEQPDTSRPTFIDPISQVRQELADGQAQPVGTVVIGGASLYKIDLPHGLVGYFGVNDYRPRYLDDPQRDGSIVRLRVIAYEYLPMTPSNRALLSVTAQHPGARIDTNPHVAPGK